MDALPNAPFNPSAYMPELTTALASFDYVAVEQMAAAVVDAQAGGRTVFIGGNGGSAAVAAHWAADLSKLTALPGQSRLRVMSLTRLGDLDSRRPTALSA